MFFFIKTLPFVEQERFKGTCYKASNWKCVGATKGTSKKGHNNVAFPCLILLSDYRFKKRFIKILPKRQIIYRLNNLNSVNPGKMFKIKYDCPYVPKDVDIKTPKIEVLSMNLEFNDGKLWVSFLCPKIPKDTDAKNGVRRDPQNASKKQKIFGYNLVLSTSVELNLKLELPVAATNIAGNGEGGKTHCKRFFVDILGENVIEISKFTQCVRSLDF